MKPAGRSPTDARSRSPVAPPPSARSARSERGSGTARPEPSGPSDPSPPAEIRSWKQGDEEAICAVIATCHGEGATSESLARWRWKHLRRPGFTPSDALVAESGTEIVGCFHGWLLPFRLEEGLSVTASFNGDWAVLPGFRGGALTLGAWNRSGTDHRSKGAVVRVGFATPDVNEGVYRKRFGSVFVTASTVCYRKPLGLPPLAARVGALGEKVLLRPKVRAMLRRAPWTVNFTIKRFPRFHVTFDSRGFHLREGRVEGADMHVSAPFALISAVPEGALVVATTALRLLVTGRLRVRGAVRSGARLAGAALVRAIDHLRRPQSR